MMVGVLLLTYLGLVSYRAGVWTHFGQAVNGSLTVGGREA